MTETPIEARAGWLTGFARGGYRVWGLVLAGILMTVLLAQIVMERVAILTDGAEVRLATAPVDPRDIFRGDYVILNYRISTLSLEDLTDTPEAFTEGGLIYVSLKEGANGIWEPVSAAPALPGQTAGVVTIRGRITSLSQTGPVTATGEAPRPLEDAAGIRLRVDYGIDQYFVPEGTGPALEADRNEGKVSVLVAVAENGNAAIKGIVLNGGDPVYLEPLF